VVIFILISKAIDMDIFDQHKTNFFLHITISFL